MNINENAAAIRAAISDSAKKAGRDPSEIKLIGVTKTVDVPRIKELLAAGVTEIGENRVQDFLPKYEEFQNSENPPSAWHFIGHLQRNKVKFIVDKVDLIHSVDSLRLAEEINRHGEKIGKKINILAEVNIAQESSKFGIPPDDVFKFVENLAGMRFVQLQGLMCVAPFVENSEKNRVFFEKMRKKIIDINERYIYHTSMESLSMGMTGDFSVAIEEGATMVRVGTALFGARLYQSLEQGGS